MQQKQSLKILEKLFYLCDKFKNSKNQALYY